MPKTFFMVERLVVRKGGGHVYDELFHPGINVIRGDHSVGKTTILELLFYVLGGEIKSNQWLYPADRCDDVVCQLRINKNIFTIRREIEKDRVPPISMRSGAFDDPDVDSEPWGVYGPRRNESDSKMSFSQKFFELLGWENHKTEDYANLTMHQILRLLYVDQETASTKIFRAEDNPRGDSDGIRTAIAEFLLGLDNLDTHQLRQELLIAEREFERISADLQAMYRVLGDESSTTLSSLQSYILANYQEIERLRSIPPERSPDVPVDIERDAKYQRISSDINLYNSQLQRFQADLLAINGEIVDCQLFDESLKSRKKALLESKAAYDAIGLVEYERCPCCLSPLDPVDAEDEEVCHLCRNKGEKAKNVSNYMEILNELDFQINSNRKVQADYVEHRAGLQSTIEVTKMKLSAAQGELATIAGMFDLVSQQALERAQRIGFLESENVSYEKKIKIIQELDNFKLRKVDLSADIFRLRELIAAATEANKGRRQKVKLGIAENVVSILHRDRRTNGKPYEEEFDESEPSGIEIDFARDRMLINGRMKFSGSSNYVKKNSLNISALMESLDDDGYRWPRFLMIDAIENGGMKEFRSHAFQRIIIDCFKGRSDFQLIFCTSMVINELNNDIYGVGPFYTDNVLQI
ncbi:AAA family ATPase [Pseudomonas aeruginosa]|uniref:AAA family ATPase n=1 Tax=Pseudomonas aeruginosa TaxID=287 RepID=UPI001557B3F7|nr:AAA family ATPase [Pseudomonas aeruginosa]MDY1125482.1 hypothetical protein [Pseudomonas aeruginosa]QKF03681.1 hypothetical protein HPT09_20640 [Pseudomonas aeruginosa]HCF1530883.1 hypothetical protein [Pseudomonas aeruginosa]